MPQFSRKYYQAVAEEMQELNRYIGEQSEIARRTATRDAAAYITGLKNARMFLMTHFADTFEEDNPRFVRHVFIKACCIGFAPDPSKGPLR